MRIVLDTNIVISALLHRGPTRRFQELWKTRKIELFATQEILSEYVHVLHYPKFGYEPQLITKLLRDDLLPWLSHVKDHPGKLAHPSSDPDDDPFLRAALSAKAGALVSGDPHLTGLNGKYPFPILAPGSFLSKHFDQGR